MKSILISLPNQHWIHTTVIHRAMMLLADKRYKTRLIMPAHKPYVNNLHHIVNDFVAGDYDFWLNIDADNPPVSKNPLDLVVLNKDIIGLPTPVWHFTNKKGERPVYLNVYDYDTSVKAYREHLPHTGLQMVDAVGTGCILIAKRVFENAEMRKGAFHRTWNEDGTVERGNDISFCERAKKQGYEIYAHYDYICDHFSELSLSETIRAFMQMYEGVNHA